MRIIQSLLMLLPSQRRKVRRRKAVEKITREVVAEYAIECRAAILKAADEIKQGKHHD